MTIRLFAMFFCLGASLPAAAADSVGVVTKVVNEAQIDGTTAVAGTSVRMNDRLRTGANARLLVTFAITAC